MNEADVKLAPDHGDIEVVEVTEILDNGTELCEANANANSPEVPSRQTCESPGSASDSMASQREVITVLRSEFVQPNVARPMPRVRSYAKKKALKKWMGICEKNELRPMRPTKLCKTYLHFRLPYHSPLVSFHEAELKYLLQKRDRGSSRQKAKPDSSALPISFDDYLNQMESFYTMFFMSESPPDSVSVADTDIDVSSVVKYKSFLLSKINSQIIDTILTTKATTEDFRCTISQAEPGKEQFVLELDWKKDLPFHSGLKVRVEGAGREMFGDVTSVLTYDEKVRLSVTLKGHGGMDQKWDSEIVTVRPVGLIGHLLLQAKALIALEHFHLYTEFLDPVMKSLSSGIELKFSDGFHERYQKQTSFYIDSIQKIVDTVALNQSDVSRICVVDDYDSSTLSDIFIDSVRYLIRQEKEIINELRAVTVIQNGIVTDEDTKSLKMVIVSKSQNVLAKLRDNLEDYASTYSVKTGTWEVIDFLKAKMDNSADPELKRVYDLLQERTPDGHSSMAYEMAKKTGREILLQSCPIVVGTIEELLNDESVCRMLQKKSRTFDVAVVHDASSFSDAELISLLLFGVSKYICFTVTAKQQGHTFADRMVRKASESNEVNSKSPVLDRSVYLLQEEQAEKEEMERRKASFAHAHSYRNNDAVRTGGDPLTRQCHDRQAQRTAPYMGHPRSRGYDHNARGRGDTSRGAYGRGGGAYQSLHHPNRNGHNNRNRL